MAAVLQILFISFSLAMDAFGVSIAGGIKSKNPKIAHAVKVAAFFGLFQAAMPIIGWLIGQGAKDIITLAGHWIAFILLGFIGIKMIREASDANKVQGHIHHTGTLLMLSVATSIDALIIGVTLSFIKIPFLISITVISIVTFILSFSGFLFGRQLGYFFGRKIEIFGGLALIVIGFKILIENLLWP